MEATRCPPQSRRSFGYWGRPSSGSRADSRDLGPAAFSGRNRPGYDADLTDWQSCRVRSQR